MNESVGQVAEYVSEMRLQLGTIHFTERALAAGFERLGAAVERQKELVARVRDVEKELEEARANNERLRQELEELRSTQRALIELLRTRQAAEAGASLGAL